MQVNYNKDGDFTISGNLYELGIEDLLQPWLVESARTIEWLKDPEYVDVWEALMVVIPYFSDPDQIQELKEYQADQEWINIVFNHNAGK
jgi:hypothetical protein